MPILGPNLDSTQPKIQSDRISINTLLDTGTDSFTKPCNLPSQKGHVSDTSNQETAHTGISSEEPIESAYAHLSDIYFHEDFASFDEAFTSIVNLPGASQNLSFLDPDIGPDVRYVLPENVEVTGTPTQTPCKRVEPTYIEALRECLLSKLNELQIREDRMDVLIRDLKFLLSVDCVERFIALYFDNWHGNCPIIHRPSFSPSAIRTSLLLAVTFFGAMYSRDPREHRSAATLLDIAELAIFSTPPFSSITSIARKLNKLETFPTESDAWEDFEDLQAAYLISTVQYWAGDESGRNRVMESRFSDIVRVSSVSSTRSVGNSE